MKLHFWIFSPAILRLVKDVAYRKQRGTLVCACKINVVFNVILDQVCVCVRVSVLCTGGEPGGDCPHIDC